MKITNFKKNDTINKEYTSYLKGSFWSKRSSFFSKYLVFLHSRIKSNKMFFIYHVTSRDLVLKSLRDLVCHIILQDHETKGWNNFMDRRPSW